MSSELEGLILGLIYGIAMLAMMHWIDKKGPPWR